jgi:hypothetical protein
MRNWFAAFIAVMAAHGCGFGTAARQCTSDEQCHSDLKQGGQCEMSTGLCSFSDSTCDSGRRYGGLAGDQSGDCVGGGMNPMIDAMAMIDAPIDMPPPIDAQVCFGTAPFTICLLEPPTTPLSITTAATINTATSPMCSAIASGGDYCVLVGTDITINAKLRATGSKPLVLLATNSITTSSVIDVGSHRGVTPETGAGADPALCVGTAPVDGGGGAGGSFIGLGGVGGASARGGSVGGMPVAAVAVTTLRGGCPGQSGNGDDPGARGHGGGAVLLIAGSAISLGDEILAGGEGGTAGTNNTSGGGGGGAGGMIVLDAPNVTNSGNSLILANGGAGGQGSGENTPGGPGADSATITAASGGMGGAVNGGIGGNGSAGMQAGSGGPGAVGTIFNPGNLRGAGGGGGGGAGVIKSPMSLGTNVSPAVTPP